MKTAQEFNSKYFYFIEKGFEGLEFENEKFIRILNEMMEDLVKIPEFQFSQIKIKWDNVRFYSNLSLHLGLAVQDYLTHKYKQLAWTEK